jgi:hypothetical protein
MKQILFSIFLLTTLNIYADIDKSMQTKLNEIILKSCNKNKFEPSINTTISGIITISIIDNNVSISTDNNHYEFIDSMKNLEMVIQKIINKENIKITDMYKKTIKLTYIYED